MKVLLISPLGFAVNETTKYAGIERLVWEYARELVKEHEVTVWGHTDSVFPQGVNLLPYKPIADPILEELPQFQSYHYTIRQFDIIHDFSHLHLTARYVVNLPMVSIFWHLPSVMRYKKAPYNLIALSQYAAREWKRIEEYPARYHQSIVVDTDLYTPNKERGDRFLTIGRMSEKKGNLAACILCGELGVPLDVVGGKGLYSEGWDSLADEYEQEVKEHCDGEKIKFLGEVTDEEKIKLMQITGATTNTDKVKIEDGAVNGYPIFGAAGDAVSIGAGGSVLVDFASNGTAIADGAADQVDLSSADTDAIVDIIFVMGT